MAGLYSLPMREVLGVSKVRTGRHTTKGRTTAFEHNGGPVVEVMGVSKTYYPSSPIMRVLLRSSIDSPVVALKDVSLSVPAGRICAIVGPNGAGKSTLFRILTGLTTPTGGSAAICGLDVSTQSFEARRLIGFAPPDSQSLLLRNTCLENLNFHGRLKGIPAKALKRRVREVLEFVDLGSVANRVAVALSSGMKARLQLARALLHRPKVLILDEPTSAIDPIAAFEMLGMIQRVVAEEGTAALISSHRLDEVEALNDDIVLMDKGRAVYQGDIDTFRKVWEEPRLEIQFANGDASTRGARVLGAIDGVEVVDVDTTVVTVATSLGVGRLFALSSEELAGIVTVRESKMPLRSLLAHILMQDGQPR